MRSARELPSASLVDIAQFNRLVVVPNALQGLFRRRPAAVAVAVRTDVDGAAVRLLAGMRRRYGGGPVWIRVMRDRALLLLDVAQIRRALEGSPAPFAADPPAKRRGMGHFQPHALTISRGAIWAERRRFTETVLDTPSPMHRLGERFAAVAREETAALLDAVDDEITWKPWHAAFRRAVRRIVLGDDAAADEELTDLLAGMMSEANRLPSGRSKRFDPFVGRLRGYVEAAEPGSLVALFGEAPSTRATETTGQVPHWLFAMSDTLPANALRALALIAAHPDRRGAVRAEIAGEPRLVERRYLRACLQDAMRLYPTTPLLSRETVAEAEIGGAAVPAGTQVLWVNLFHHRDRDRLEFADRFAPEAWTDGAAGGDWSFNHFSHGPQGCPGAHLAVLVGTAVLSEVLETRDVRLQAPHLAVDEPLPHMLDVFRTRVALAPPGPRPA
jgi:cytochrome P450